MNFLYRHPIASTITGLLLLIAAYAIGSTPTVALIVASAGAVCLLGAAIKVQWR